MGFSRQEHWSGLPCPPLGDLPDPGIKPMSLMFPALAGGFLTTSATQEAHLLTYIFLKIYIQDHTINTVFLFVFFHLICFHGVAKSPT